MDMATGKATARACETDRRAADHSTLTGHAAGSERPAQPTQTTASDSRPPGGPVRLWLQDGDTSHPLAVGVNSVGRLPENAIVLGDDLVSRWHCAVVVDTDGRCEVYDLTSRNGTALNGKKITGPTRVRPGDQIAIGAHRLTLVEVAAGPPA
jgi:pSer/pThr/pTyr-binding forkhead associated (FHA) protein